MTRVEDIAKSLVDNEKSQGEAENKSESQTENLLGATGTEELGVENLLSSTPSPCPTTPNKSEGINGFNAVEPAYWQFLGEHDFANKRDLPVTPCILCNIIF